MWILGNKSRSSGKVTAEPSLQHHFPDSSLQKQKPLNGSSQVYDLGKKIHQLSRSVFICKNGMLEFFIIIVYIFTWMYVNMCAWYPWNLKEGVGSPGTRVRSVGELPRGY